MKPGAPWSIKGIDPEAREAAKKAAAKVGMTLGEFFNHILLEADPAGIVSGDIPSEPASRRMSATAAEPDIAGAAQAGAVRDLAERLEKSESKTIEDVSGIRQSIAQLSEQISASRGPEGEPSEVSQKALDDVIYQIGESRLHNENAIAETQGTLSEISQRIEASISRSNEAVTTVGKAIEVIAGRLDKLETNALEAAPAAGPAEPALDPIDEIEQGAGDGGFERQDDSPELDAGADPETPALSAEERISNFDVDAYLSEKAEQIGLDPAADAGPEADPEPYSDAEPTGSTSVDDFLNQFGEDMLVNKELPGQEPLEDQEFGTAYAEAGPSDFEEIPPVAPVDTAAADELPAGLPGSERKNPQDVIEAIRQAAKSTSLPGEQEDDSVLTELEDGFDEDEERLELDTVASYRQRHQPGSSRVKYAIYAACAAVLLAASGLIASVKGLI